MLTHRLLSRLRLAAPLAALTLLSPLASFGQMSVAAVPRIQGVVDPANTVTLKGTRPAFTRGPADLGRVADSASGRMVLLLDRSPEQQSALDQFLAAQKDPKSAHYHQWLTPEQFGARFGVSDADLQTVSSYLSAQGFAVGRTYKGKTAIEFSGTAAQVRASFGTEVHSYQANGRTFTANASDVQVPRALASVVHGIAGLSNYRQPQAHGTVAMVRDAKTGKSHPLYADQNNGIESVSPGDLAVIYDIPTKQFDGTGVTVGIISDSNVNLAIPAAYRTTFGLPANDPAVVVDGVDPGIAADADLTYGQIELVSATAPAAKINVYTAADTDLSPGIDLASVRAVEDNTVNVLVFGYEGCEANFTPSRLQFYQSVWEQAAAQGISVVVTSGSAGAAGCDVGTDGNGVALASHGLAVNGYASTPYNTAVGSSDFYYGPNGAVSLTNLGGFLQYWSEDNSSYTSAKGYIPEQPFNVSNQANNQIQFDPSVIASGGGVSNPAFTTPAISAVAHSNIGQPSYQSAVAPQISFRGRVVPDVSIFGAFPANGSTYILCILATDCVGGSPDGGLAYNGVLSPNVSVGAFGGIAALIVQAKGVQGNLNPNLYAASATPGAFHDIVNGNNQVQCVAGSPDCVGGYTTGYQALPGFDAASGLGSADVANLINAWPAAKPAATLTVSLTKNGKPVSSFQHDDLLVQLNVTVAGSSATPTGDVSINTTALQPASSAPEFLTLAGGTANDPLVANILPGGSYNVVARYAGDSVYGATTAVLPVTVSQVTSKLVLLTTDQSGNPLPNSYTGQTLPYGSHVEFTFEVGDLNDGNDPQAATGYVQLFDNGTQVGTLHLDALGFATFISTSLTPGPHVFSANYAGDPTFSSARLSGPAPSLVIAGVPTTTTLASTDPSIAARNSATYLVATVTPSAATAGGIAPGGTVNFFAGTTLLGTARLDRGNNSGSSPSATAAFLMKGNTFNFGTPSPVALTATYVPDGTGEYQASTSAAVNFNVGFTRGIANSSTSLVTTPTAGVTTFLNTSVVSFSATVASNGGGNNTPPPTGNVSFFSNGQLIQQSHSNGTAVPNPVPLVNGVAAFTIDPNLNPNANFTLPVPTGQSYIIAQYNGDANHTPSTVAYTINVYDEQSTPDFQLRSDLTYGTATGSAKASYSLEVDALKGFDTLKQRVALTFTTPANITCSTTNQNPLPNPVSQLTVTCGAGPGVTVAAVQPAPLIPGHRGLLWASEGGAALACLFLFGLPARRRSWQSLLGAVLLIAASVGISGCGTTLASGLGKSSSQSLSQGAPGANATLAKGTYTVIVTGTATVLSPTLPNTTMTVVHTLPLKLVVQ